MRINKIKKEKLTEDQQFQQLVKVCNWLVQEDMKQNPNLYKNHNGRNKTK
jgi:hypothetical protein